MKKYSLLIAGIALVILIMIIGSGCSTVKSKNTNKEKTSEQISVKEKIASENTTDTDAKIKTVITEQVDTAVDIPGSKLEGSKDLKDLKDSPLRVESHDQNVIVSMDSVTGKISVTAQKKPQTINVKINKRTDRTEDIKQQSKTNTKAKTALTKSTDAEKKSTDKDVKRTFFLPWWLWLIIVLVIIAVYLIRRFKIRLPIPF
jgi:uncharacterized protein YceK